MASSSTALRPSESSSSSSSSSRGNSHVAPLPRRPGTLPTPNRERSLSYRTNTPSPLRYATSYESTTSLSLDSSSVPESVEKSDGASEPQRRPSSMFLKWSGKTREPRLAPHTVYPPSTPIRSSSSHSGRTFSSSYSADVESSSSDSSIPIILVHGPSSPRTSRSAQRRSVGKIISQSSKPGASFTANHTWTDTPSESSKAANHNQTPATTGTSRRPDTESTAILGARRRGAPVQQLNPLLAHVRFQRPPITYDVSHPPAPHTLVDRRTRAPIPASALAQAATKPSAPTLTFTSPKFPWSIVATSARSSSSKSRPDKDLTTPVTVLDILHAVHITLAVRVTPQEWAALGQGTRAQRRILQAYEKRCVRTGGGWDEGVRRIDFLCGNTLLVGVDVDKNEKTQGVVGKLMFASP